MSPHIGSKLKIKSENKIIKRSIINHNTEKNLIPAASIKNLLKIAEKLGISSLSILKQAQIPIRVLILEDEHVSFKAFLTVFDLLAQKSKDPNISIYVAQNTLISAFEEYGKVIHSAKNLLEALQLAVKFYPTWTDTSSLKLKLEKSKVVIYYEVHSKLPLRLIRYDVEYTFALIKSLSDKITSKCINPVKVCFAHKCYFDKRKIKDVFSITPEFQSKVNSITYKINDLLSPINQTDQNQQSKIIDKLISSLKIINRNKPLLKRICDYIYSELPEGNISIVKAAKSLGYSVRSLQRELQNNKTSWRELVDEIRFIISEQYRKDPNISNKELSYILGYKDDSTFHRAKTRWITKSKLKST